jgi:hypothetical protein
MLVPVTPSIILFGQTAASVAAAAAAAVRTA